MYSILYKSISVKSRLANIKHQDDLCISSGGREPCKSRYTNHLQDTYLDLMKI